MLTRSVWPSLQVLKHSTHFSETTIYSSAYIICFTDTSSCHPNQGSYSNQWLCFKGPHDGIGGTIKWKVYQERLWLKVLNSLLKQLINYVTYITSNKLCFESLWCVLFNKLVPFLHDSQDCGNKFTFQPAGI